MLKDFHEEVGDRRQELVFIGLNVKKALLSATLDACLCETDDQVPLAAWCNCCALLEISAVRSPVLKFSGPPRELRKTQCL